MGLKEALICQNQGKIPCWLMRQAGRYLPSYKKYRENASLLELFHDPQKIVEITLLPLAALPLDAAILFSDILTVLDGLGVSYDFTPGPIIDFQGISRKKGAYKHIEAAIRTLKKELSLPLLGFAGAPFTIASYLIEGSTTKNFSQMKRYLFSKPKEFHELLEEVTEETIAYLRLQAEAGVDAIQIFDSWACHVGPKEFRTFSLPYLRKIVDAMKPHLPVIIFARGPHALDIAKISPSAISLDWSYDLPEMRAQIPSTIALQGNLDPSLLFSTKEEIQKSADSLLKAMQGDPGYIFNLGHGLLPEIPYENVQFLVEHVASFRVQ